MKDATTEARSDEKRGRVMKMFRQIVLSSVVLLAAGTAQGQDLLQPFPQPPAGDQPMLFAGEPKLVFEKTTHDFGKIPDTDKVSAELKFRNTGGGLLRISNVQAGCGCTVTELAKREYQPGDAFADASDVAPPCDRAPSTHAVAVASEVGPPHTKTPIELAPAPALTPLPVGAAPPSAPATIAPAWCPSARMCALSSSQLGNTAWHTRHEACC
jgi:hypothetical protein